MAQNFPRASTPLQPPSKAQTTSSSFGFAATAARTPPASRAPSQVRARDTSRKPIDTKSDAATANFVRRTLCAHQVHGNALTGSEKGGNTPPSIEELLPPLTSSNETDLQLYAFIAIIIKEFVYSWYGKITPDHTFVDEVIQIIAHCTRTLEQRLRKVDLEALLLDEIPELVEAHITAYRLAHHPLHPGPLALDPCDLYHQLHPHPALSPPPNSSEPSTIVEQQENEEHWRQLLAQSILAIILPTDDLENSCLRSLVTEVLSEMILRNGIGGRLCEGWFIWGAITKIVELIQFRATSVSNVKLELEPSDAPGSLRQYDLVGSRKATKAEPSEVEGKIGHQRSYQFGYFSHLFWTGIQYMVISFIALRTLIVALATSSSLPARSLITIVPATSSPAPAQEQASPINDSHATTPGTGPSPKSSGSTLINHERRAAKKRPVASMRLWSCIGRLLELDVRMPWLAGLLSLFHDGVVSGPGRMGDTDGALDRVLSHHIHATLLNPSNLPPLLLALRTALFPNNALAPTPLPPTAATILATRNRCATAIVDAIPPVILTQFFSSSETRGSRYDGDQGADETTASGGSGGRDLRRDQWIRDVEQQMLVVFESAYLNKHLLYAITELVVVRVFPEMAEKGTEALMTERLN